MSKNTMKSIIMMMAEASALDADLGRLDSECRDAYTKYNDLCNRRDRLRKDIEALHKELTNAYAGIDLAGKCFRNRNDGKLLCKVLSRVTTDASDDDPLRAEYNCLVVTDDPGNPGFHTSGHTISFIGTFNLMDEEEFNLIVNRLLKEIL